MYSFLWILILINWSTRISFCDRYYSAIVKRRLAPGLLLKSVLLPLKGYSYFPPPSPSPPAVGSLVPCWRAPLLCRYSHRRYPTGASCCLASRPNAATPHQVEDRLWRWKLHSHDWNPLLSLLISSHIHVVTGCEGLPWCLCSRGSEAGGLLDIVYLV